MFMFAKCFGLTTLVVLMGCTVADRIRSLLCPPAPVVERMRDWNAENERDAARSEAASAERRHAERVADLERQLAVAQANERAFKVACEFYQRHAILPPPQAGEPGRLPRMNLPVHAEGP